MKLKSIDLLKETKSYISSSLIDFYLDMIEDLEVEHWPAHMAELGTQLGVVEKVNSMSDLVRKIDSQELVTPSTLHGEDEILDETLNIVIMTYMNKHYSPKDSVIEKY